MPDSNGLDKFLKFANGIMSLLANFFQLAYPPNG